MERPDDARARAGVGRCGFATPYTTIQFCLPKNGYKTMIRDMRPVLTSCDGAFHVLMAYSNVSTAVCCSTATWSLLNGPTNGTSNAASTCVSDGNTFGRLLDVEDVSALAMCVTVGAARELIARDATLCGRLSPPPVTCLVCDDPAFPPEATDALEDARNGRCSVDPIVFCTTGSAFCVRAARSPKRTIMHALRISSASR